MGNRVDIHDWDNEVYRLEQVEMCGTCWNYCEYPHEAGGVRYDGICVLADPCVPPEPPTVNQACMRRGAPCAEWREL